MNVARSSACCSVRKATLWSGSRPLSSLVAAAGSPSAAFHTSVQTFAGPSSASVEEQSAPSPFRPRPRRYRSPRSRILFALGWIPVAAFITSHVCSIGNVTGASMSPTFNGPRSEALAPGARSDVVLLNRTVQVSQRYQVGDIITLISPLDPRLLLTKRIIALPGDSVRVWAPAASAADLEKGKGRWTRIKIPPGHVWIEGDAAVDIAPSHFGQMTSSTGQAHLAVQTKSRDSREFGPVPMGLITSRIGYILWPPRRFGPPASRPVSSSATKANQFPPSLSSADGSVEADMLAIESSLHEEFANMSTQVNPSLSRILDELSNTPKRSRADSPDSVLSPFVDYDKPNQSTSSQTAAEKEKNDTSKAEHRFKHAWNSLSRGGRLGDDAE